MRNTQLMRAFREGRKVGCDPAQQHVKFRPCLTVGVAASPRSKEPGSFRRIEMQSSAANERVCSPMSLWSSATRQPLEGEPEDRGSGYASTLGVLATLGAAALIAYAFPGEREEDSSRSGSLHPPSTLPVKNSTGRLRPSSCAVLDHQGGAAAGLAEALEVQLRLA